MDYKKITPWEYALDPFIMYSTLWGCAGFSYILYNYEYQDNQLYHQYNLIGPITSGEDYLRRIRVKPFSLDGEDYVTRDRTENITDTTTKNNVAFLKATVYAKNIIEPIYFTQYVLFMRSKNYHPALVITETILLSVLYELTIRPFLMPFSFEQLIKNPSVALLIGIFLDEISTFLLTTPYKALHVLAYILNPYKLLPTSRVRPLLMFKPYRKALSIETIIKM
ncbi:MAG: hypothetical protein MJB14_23010 [Spirochaetes bacterium]|nr:hypothetical protein [Spirochaetota bacterium]